jgi:hypothetical protein
MDGSPNDSIVIAKFDLAASSSSALIEEAEFGLGDPPHETSASRVQIRVIFINRMMKLYSDLYRNW